MKEKIIERLKALFPTLNLSKERMDAIADKLASKITEEGDIDERLNDLNEVISFEEIAKQDDKIRSLSKKKPEQKKEEPPKQEEPPKEETKDDTPAWAKTLMAEISTLKADKVATSRKEMVAAKLKDADDKYKSRILRDFGRMKIDSDEDFETYLADVESDFSDYKQTVTNEGLGKDRPANGIAVGSNGKVKEAPKEEQDEIFELIKK